MKALSVPNTETLVYKKPGFLVPDGYFEKILSYKPTAFGFTVQDKNETGDTTLVSSQSNLIGQSFNISDLQEIQKNALDYPVQFYFGFLDPGFDEKDIQPFLIADGDGNDFLAIMLEGDFPTFNGADKGRTDTSNVANKILIPKMMEMCEDFDGDIEKIVKKLNGDVFNSDFLSRISHRGVMQIMPFAGDTITYGKNELGEVYDWGHVSNTHGFGEVEQALKEPVVEVKAKKVFWSKSAEPVQSSLPLEQPKKVEEKPAEGPKPDANGIYTVKDAATVGTAPKTSVPTVKKEKEFIRPPDFVQRNEDLKQWYRVMNGGVVPSAWKKRIAIGISSAKPIVINNLKDLQQALETRDAKTSTAIGAPPKVETEVKTEVKSSDNTSDDLPILNAKQLEDVLSFVAKHLDGQSKTMPDPASIQRIEAKLPVFSEAIGLKPEELFSWPTSAFFALGKENHRALALLAIELRRRAMGNMKVSELVNTSPKEEVPPKVAAAAGGKRSFWQK